MPYIKENDRFRIQSGLGAECAGELNYIFSYFAICYIEDNGLTYRTINDIVGALEGTKAEFQRRVVAPYEDRKITENGDLAWPTTT